MWFVVIADTIIVIFNPLCCFIIYLQCVSKNVRRSGIPKKLGQTSPFFKDTNTIPVIEVITRTLNTAAMYVECGSNGNKINQFLNNFYQFEFCYVRMPTRLL
jgi:hypothetical protein